MKRSLGEITKDRYVYYDCTVYKVKCPEPYTREEVFEEQCTYIFFLNDSATPEISPLPLPAPLPISGLYEPAQREPRFKPVPTVHPGLAGWEQVLADAANGGAPAVRCDPLYLGLDPAGGAMRVLAAACGAARLPLLLAEI